MSLLIIIDLKKKVKNLLNSPKIEKPPLSYKYVSQGYRGYMFVVHSTKQEFYSFAKALVVRTLLLHSYA